MSVSLNNAVGLLGEYKILEFFIKNSIHSIHANTGSTDIVCFSAKERPLRVQVKTISSWESGNNGFKVNHGAARTTYDKNEFEVLALVVLDFNDIFFLNSEAMSLIIGSSKQGSIKRHSLLKFTKSQTHVEGWNRAIRGLYPSYEIETKHEFIEYSSEEKNDLIGKYKYYLSLNNHDTSFIEHNSVKPLVAQRLRDGTTFTYTPPDSSKTNLPSVEEIEKKRIAKKLVNARYYQRNKEKFRLAQNKWLAKGDNKEKQKQKRKEWRATGDNKEIVNQRQKDKYHKNKELIERLENESRIRRLYGNRLDSSERGEGQLQQGVLV